MTVVGAYMLCFAYFGGLVYLLNSMGMDKR